MKRYYAFVIVFIPVLLICNLRTFAQDRTPPADRFAIRWNALGLLNLDGIGEIEYSVSDQCGIFVGGGSREPLVDLNRLGWTQYRRADDHGWGLYAGVRLPFDIGKFHGLSIKPSIGYFRFQGHDEYFSPFVGPGFQVYYIQNQIGGYMSLAYTKTFGKRFFVEPVIGLGPTFGQTHVKGAAFEYMGLSVPAQLNLGVRF